MIRLVQKRLLDLLRERGSLRGRQIDSHFARVDWRKTASVLVKKGILSTKHVLPPPRVRPKFLRVAQLSVPPEEAEAAMDSSWYKANSGASSSRVAIPHPAARCDQSFMGLCRDRMQPRRFAGARRARFDPIVRKRNFPRPVGKYWQARQADRETNNTNT